MRWQPKQGGRAGGRPKIAHEASSAQPPTYRPTTISPVRHTNRSHIRPVELRDAPGIVSNVLEITIPNSFSRDTVPYVKMADTTYARLVAARDNWAEYPANALAPTQSRQVLRAYRDSLASNEDCLFDPDDTEIRFLDASDDGTGTERYLMSPLTRMRADKAAEYKTTDVDGALTLAHALNGKDNKPPRSRHV